MKVTIEKTCCVCHKPARVEVDEDAWDEYIHGMKAQDAFPDLSPDQREIIISGTHPECWNKLFER